jgi:hypothetical protein
MNELCDKPTPKTPSAQRARGAFEIFTSSTFLAFYNNRAAGRYCVLSIMQKGTATKFIVIEWMDVSKNLAKTL